MDMHASTTTVAARNDVIGLNPEPWVLDFIEGSPLASVITNPRMPDNPIIACNQAFMELTGYSRPEILGRNCRFLAGEGTEDWLTAKMREGIEERKPVLVELLNYKKDGTPFRNAVMVAPIYAPDDEEELRYFLGSQVELPENGQGPSPRRQARAAEAVRALSPRQFEVLSLVARGLRNKQIAYELGLAEKTVKMHRALAMEKLGVRSAADMIRLAVEAGI